jgi:hypothetical protein
LVKLDICLINGQLLAIKIEKTPEMLYIFNIRIVKGSEGRKE